jgi:hypothetical protein
MENMMQCAGWIALGVGIFLGLGFLVMLLWNWLVPAISSLKRVTYLQALGILILARLLFGGFGPGAHGWGRHWNNNSSYCSGKWGGCNSQKDCSTKTDKVPDVK